MERKLEFGELKDWQKNRFVPISVDNYILYGGNQSWLRKVGVSNFWIKRACGIIAAANVFYYYHKNFVDKKSLYNKEDVSLKNFTLFMKELIESGMRPSIAGICNTSMLINRVKKWAKHCNTPIEAVKYKGKYEIENVCKFISQALNENKPVLMLTWNSSKNDLKWHWVTITKIYENDTVKMVTSNWGEQKEYDLEKWVKEISIHKELVYFQ